MCTVIMVALKLGISTALGLRAPPRRVGLTVALQVSRQHALEAVASAWWTYTSRTHPGMLPSMYVLFCYNALPDWFYDLVSVYGLKPFEDRSIYVQTKPNQSNNR